MEATKKLSGTEYSLRLTSTFVGKKERKKEKEREDNSTGTAPSYASWF